MDAIWALCLAAASGFGIAYFRAWLDRARRQHAPGVVDHYVGCAIDAAQVVAVAIITSVMAYWWPPVMTMAVFVGSVVFVFFVQVSPNVPAWIYYTAWGIAFGLFVTLWLVVAVAAGVDLTAAADTATVATRQAMITLLQDLADTEVVTVLVGTVAVLWLLTKEKVDRDSEPGRLLAA